MRKSWFLAQSVNYSSANSVFHRISTIRAAFPGERDFLRTMSCLEYEGILTS
jgi:hypothetical protein